MSIFTTAFVEEEEPKLDPIGDWLTEQENPAPFELDNELWQWDRAMMEYKPFAPPPVQQASAYDGSMEPPLDPVAAIEQRWQAFDAGGPAALEPTSPLEVAQQEATAQRVGEMEPGGGFLPTGEIPYVAPASRVLGSALGTAGRFAGNVLAENVPQARAAADIVGVDPGAVGEEVGRALNPLPEDWAYAPLLGLEAVPGVGTAPDIARLARSVAPDVARGTRNVIRGAMPEPSLSAYGAGVPPIQPDDLAGQVRKAGVTEGIQAAPMNDLDWAKGAAATSLLSKENAAMWAPSLTTKNRQAVVRILRAHPEDADAQDYLYQLSDRRYGAPKPTATTPQPPHELPNFDDMPSIQERAAQQYGRPPAPAPVTPSASTAAPSPMETPAGAGQPQVLRLAVREGSTAPSAEGLAASRGAETITDPTGVRILKEGEAPAAGERLMHHGTAGPIEGGVLRQGAELIPDPNDAMTFATVSARIESQAAPSARTGTAPRPAGSTPASSAQGGGTPPPPPAAPPPTGTAGDAGFAGNIRLSKYPEESQQLVKSWADAHPDEIGPSRRGVRSDAQVRADAEALVNDVGGDFEKLQKSWKPGDAWNAEEITAIRGTLTDATMRVQSAAAAAVADPGAIGKHLDLAGAIMDQQRVQNIVYGVAAEAGRSTRAFRQQAAAILSSGDVRQMQALLQRSIGTSDPKDMVTLATALKTLDEIDPAKANRLIRDVNKPDFWDKLHYYWMNSILSGPLTQARNIVGNASASLYAPVQRLGAAAIEQPLAAIQGRQAQRFWQEAPASVAGLVQGIPEGVKGALTTLRTGISPRAAAKLEVRPQPIKGAAGRVIGAPVTALGMMDEFFSAINYRSSLNANAVRMARSEGLKGEALSNRIADLVNDPPPNLMQKSTDQAEELVFRGDPGDIAHWLVSGRQKVPGLRYILPFVNTPANLLKYGVKNSPLGLLDSGAWRKALAGNPEGADELAKGVMGSMVAASLSTLVATGAIDLTAAAPVNSAERDRFYREGKRPFSVKLPGVGWVEYKSIPALDTTFTLVASAVDGIRRGEDVGGIVSQAGANIATNLLDKSYMSGLGDLFDAVQDPIRGAESYLTRQTSGFVPASVALRQTAQALDPTIRSPQNIQEQLQASIPGLTGNVPPRLTAFGEETRRGFPSPIAVSPDKQSKVDAELERLGEEVNFVGRSIANVELTREQRADYQRAAGQMTYHLLDRVISKESYAKLDDSMKQKLVEELTYSGRDFFREPFAAIAEDEDFKSAPPEFQQQILERLGDRLVQKVGEMVGTR